MKVILETNGFFLATQSQKLVHSNVGILASGATIVPILLHMRLTLRFAIEFIAHIHRSAALKQEFLFEIVQMRMLVGARFIHRITTEITVVVETRPLVSASGVQIQHLSGILKQQFTMSKSFLRQEST